MKLCYLAVCVSFSLCFLTKSNQKINFKVVKQIIIIIGRDPQTNTISVPPVF